MPSFPDWRDKGSPLTTEVSEDRFYYLWKTGGIRVPNLFMPPLMSNHGCYTGSLGALTSWLAEQAEALGVEIYPGFSVVDVIFGASGEIEGVITGDMGVARDGSHKDNYTPGIAIARQIHLVRRRRARLALEDADPQARPRRRVGPAEIRHRPEGAMGGAGREAQAGSRAAHHGLAARRQDRRRLLPLSFRRAAGVGGLRRPSRLRESLSQPVQGISARQDASADRRASRRRQAHRLWRARADRRRLPGHPAARLSRRRADRLRGRLHECAAHQGQPQRDAVRDDGGGGGVRGDSSRGVRATCSKPIRKACGRAPWRKS